jgi:hypothetical protein
VDRRARPGQSAEQDLQVGDGAWSGGAAGVGLVLDVGLRRVAGESGGGEADGWAGVDLEERRPRGGWQVEGVGNAEDGGGLGGAEGPEADPEAEVAVEAAQAALVEALGGRVMRTT